MYVEDEVEGSGLTKRRAADYGHIKFKRGAIDKCQMVEVRCFVEDFVG